MGEVVDARGLACPQPVILTKQALKKAREVTVIVDNDTARRNVSMAAEKQGASVAVQEKTDGIFLLLNKTAEDTEKKEPIGKTTVVIPDRSMGRGSPELGDVLIRGFFHALAEQDELPGNIIFFNSGVHLVVEGSEVIDDLRKLEAAGVEIIACGTCLDFFNCKNKVEIGEVSNMYTIVESMMESEKIIQL